MYSGIRPTRTPRPVRRRIRVVQRLVIGSLSNFNYVASGIVGAFYSC